MNPFIRTFSGKKVSILDPKPGSITIEDGAHALSQIVRFTGHAIGPYTVAQHCVHACDMAPQELKKSALLHDLQESWVGDCASPLKACLPQYQEIEAKFERLIAKKWKIPYPHPALVKEIDRRMLTTEMKQLLPGSDYKNYPFEPYDMKIVIWTPQKARAEFMKRYRKLFA